MAHVEAGVIDRSISPFEGGVGEQPAYFLLVELVARGDVTVKRPRPALIGRLEISRGEVAKSAFA